MSGHDPNEYVTREEADRIADRAADRAVTRTFRTLGIDDANWQEVQRTMQWAHRARKGQEQLLESARSGVAKTAAGSLTAGVLFLLWWIVTTFSKAKGGP